MLDPPDTPAPVEPRHLQKAGDLLLRYAHFPRQFDSTKRMIAQAMADERAQGEREGERRAAQRFARAIPKVIGTPWATMLMDLVFAIEDGYVLPWEEGEVLKVPREPEVDGA